MKAIILVASTLSLAGCGETCDTLASDYRETIASGMRAAADGLSDPSKRAAAENEMTALRSKLDKIQSAMTDKKCPPVQ